MSTASLGLSATNSLSIHTFLFLLGLYEEARGDGELAGVALPCGRVLQFLGGVPLPQERHGAALGTLHVALHTGACTQVSHASVIVAPFILQNISL
jgi:hypothetical protein